MLQVARLAPRHLGSAAEKVESFLRGKVHGDGGGVDRAGNSDLYYTVFMLDGLVALQATLPTDATRRYLNSFGAGADLDLVHLCCLARCLAALAERPADAEGIASNLARFRSADGGFHSEVGAERGSVYHAFLGLGAHQDIGIECPGAAALADSVEGLRSKDGAYANTPGLPLGSTTVSAAAVTMLRYLGRSVPVEVGDWLLARVHAEGGGFLAAPMAPMPDLLSTATALHALAGLQVDFESVREPCLDFLDSLWTGQAFCGHWAEEATDSEYTFYALLALGHLSV
jgi:geranylgeranyl transferase type-2 subunit beta